MLRFLLLFSLIICPLVICKRRQHKEKEKDSSGSDLGGKLVSNLRNDANIDLSADEEYEDLRAELLAYHTALASLTSDTRRSMKTTPCWQLGGICISQKMCEGHHFLTEVNGCRDFLEVCCFTWNNFQMRNFRDQGVAPPMPWSLSQGFGGQGVIDPPKRTKDKKKKRPAHDIEKSDENPPIVVLLRLGGVIMLVVSNVLCQGGNANRRSAQLPETFVDVFKPGSNGRPTLGTTQGTCWARGGICVPIKSCPSLNMDVAVSGCAWGYMVCCKVHAKQTPTVGNARKDSIPVVTYLEELGTPLEIIALRNSMLLSRWQSEKSESNNNINILGDLLNK
ncbi:hypothetical protein PYW07_014672 [Mythimna separata]|uniref:Uncharacterized protein n=1 Tax=Mythimna separata TaxID=271217 RepID=A0AAD7YZY3_MYTSE|nr:hypothetical protein PYW07_014672 [Mythimna separata]